jgi:NAD(P)H-hydrate epimerase
MFLSSDLMLLTPEEMANADAAAAASGLSSFGLMQRAGYAVAASALNRFPQAKRFVVLCGPGNNGGDGYIAAAALAESGCETVVFALGDPDALKGDARMARDAWKAPVYALDQYEPKTGEVVIDAIFGAGLSRAVPDGVAQVIAAVKHAGVPVLAVDLPSGLCGRRGTPLGASIEAASTVTFMARKPGHLLLPGRSLCGDVEVVDIGIPKRILAGAAGPLSVNGPQLWQSHLPAPGADSHKYKRGHLAVFSGEAGKTGAARLAAISGLRSGAGAVTLASAQEAMAVNAGHLTAIMLRQIETVADLHSWLDAAKLSAFVMGPGFGIGARTRDFVLTLKHRPVVLDADGISSFRDCPEDLFRAFAEGAPRLVLTPHEGEFGRLFPDLAESDNLSKVEKARLAAKRANAAVVYKGADSVVAAPDGRACINENGPPWLATAGSGDVLAGMIGALLAQGMPAFEAAAAGVFLHGTAARLAGAGMTAEDLAGQAGHAMAKLASAR